LERTTSTSVGIPNNIIAEYTIQIDPSDDTIIRAAAPISDLASGTVGLFVPFGIQPIATNQGTITNLCLT
jgi:hypothetical protein